MVHEKNFSRLGMGPPEKTSVDWAWLLQGKFLVDWAFDLQEKHLLSEARTRAAGGGEVKTGEEELLLMQEPR